MAIRPLIFPWPGTGRGASACPGPAWRNPGIAQAVRGQKQIAPRNLTVSPRCVAMEIRASLPILRLLRDGHAASLWGKTRAAPRKNASISKTIKNSSQGRLT